MATQTRKTASFSQAADAPAIKVILADGQAIYRVGIRKIFALEDDIRVVAQAETLGQALVAVSRFPADIFLMESSLTEDPAAAIAEVLKRQAGIRTIVVTSELDQEDTVEYLRRGARGILQKTISPDLLVKCVRRVHGGETWLDNRGVNWLIDAYRNQALHLTAHPPKARLNEKELLIIAGVTQGMRNKEIAAEVGTTEQVVKNYLRKVYDKLGVSDRLELALYCIHHRLLHGRLGAAAAAADTPPAEAGPSTPNPTSKA